MSTNLFILQYVKTTVSSLQNSILITDTKLPKWDQFNLNGIAYVVTPNLTKQGLFLIVRKLYISVNFWQRLQAES